MAKRKSIMDRTWLRLARMEKDFTQSQVADAAGISVASYSLIESGFRVPSVDTAIRITDYLGVSIRNFVTEKALN